MYSLKLYWALICFMFAIGINGIRITDQPQYQVTLIIILPIVLIFISGYCFDRYIKELLKNNG